MGKERLPRWKVITRAGILLGFGLLIAGFIVRDVSPPSFARAAHLTLGLWIAACVLVLAGIGLNFKALIGSFRTGRAAEGANFALVVVLSIGLAALLCYISTRRFARMDWTGKRKYKLHSKTENILRALDRDVEVTLVFAHTDPTVSAWVPPTRDMLEEFSALSPHMRVRDLDWSLPESKDRLEELLARLREDSLPMACVTFATVESHEIVPAAKIVESSYGPMGPVQSFSGEDAFATALTKLTETEKITIYALTGHGERMLEAEAPGFMGRQEPTDILSGPEYSLSRAVKRLRKDNYEVKTLNLAAEGVVPEDCAALIIAGPRAPLSESELEALRHYFDNRNGGAVVMFDPEVITGTHTNLQELLTDYGIQVHTEAVGIANLPSILGTIQGPEVRVIAEGMAGHAITADLKNFDFVARRACPLEIVNPRPREMLQARQLLTGTETSWGETDYRPDSRRPAEYDPGRDVAPPAIVAAVVEPQPPPAGPMGPPPSVELSGPRIVVIGSSLAFVNAAVELEPGNLYLLLNAVNWMAGKLHMLGIPPKTVEFNTVSVSDSQIRLGRYLLIGILPGCIVVLGIGVWLARRR